MERGEHRVPGMKRRSLAPLLLSPLLAQAQTPQRVVSVGGAITETIYALGAEPLLVGVDSTSFFPAAAAKLPQVGYARTLSAEGLLALAPQLLIAGSEAGPPLVLQQLRGAGLRVEQLGEGHRFDSLLARTERIAALLGRDPQPLLARLRADWGIAQAELARLKTQPRVLFVLAHAANSLRVAGEDTAADAMLRLAGARNALAGLQGYKPLTPEAALQASPDVILCTHQGLQAQGGIDGLLKAPGLALTPAGRARRVVAMDALLLLGFGPRLPQAVRELMPLLHAA